MTSTLFEHLAHRQVDWEVDRYFLTRNGSLIRTHASGTSRQNGQLLYGGSEHRAPRPGWHNQWIWEPNGAFLCGDSDENDFILACTLPPLVGTIDRVIGWVYESDTFLWIGAGRTLAISIRDRHEHRGPVYTFHSMPHIMRIGADLWYIIRDPESLPHVESITHNPDGSITVSEYAVGGRVYTLTSLRTDGTTS